MDTASSAEEAIEKLDQKGYDAIISDYQMPGMDGLEFLKYVRERLGIDLPFIIFTGKGREEIAMEALNLGAERYIQKGGDLASQYEILADAVNQEVRLYRAEQARERLSSIVRSSQNAIIGKDLDGIITSWNRGAEEIYGYSEEEILGEHISIIAPEEKKDEIDEIMQEVKEGRKVEPFETERLTKDGKKIHVSLTVSPMFDKNGEAMGASTIAQDITKRKKAEEKLKEREEKYKAVTEKSHDAIFMVGEEELLFVNERTSALTGYSKEELYQIDFWELLHPDDRERVMDIDTRGRKGESAPTKYEARIVTKEGRVKHCDFRVTPIEYGDTPVILGTVRDVTDRKEADRKLEESEERYRRLFEAAQDGILILDGGTGEIVDVNPYLLDILSYSREELLGKRLWQIGTFKDIVENRSKFEELKERGFVRYDDLPLQTRDDDEVPVEFVSNTYEAGNEEVIQCNIRDITERKRAEDRLQRERDRARRYFDIAGVILVALDSDGIVTAINKKGCEVLGCERDEILGVDWYENFVPQRVRDQVVKDIMDPLLAGDFEGTEGYENPVLTKDGEERVIHWNNTALTVEGGEIIGTLSSGRDITEKIEIEEEMEKLSTVVKIAKDAVVISDMDGTIVEANRATLDMYGADRKEEIVGKKAFDFILPEDRDEARKDKERVLKDGYISLGEYRITDNDGNEISVEMSVSLLRDKEDDPIGFAGIIRDVTERREIQEREDLLHSLLRHDVRNKIYLAQGYLQLMENTEMSEKARDFLGKTKKDIRECMEVISKVSTLRQAQKEEIKPVNVKLSLDYAIEQSKDLLNDRKVSLETVGIHQDHEALAGTLLSQVFYNLIENSVLHSEGDRIKIVQKKKDDRVTVTIEDNGTGIPDDKKEVIFNDGYTTDKERGTGLGLFLTKTLLDIYGATIEVGDSDLGGARFDVELKGLSDDPGV